MIEFDKKYKSAVKLRIGIAAASTGRISFSMSNTAVPAEKARSVSKAWALLSLILNGLDGKEHNPYGWRGQVIMMNFRATWCGPCQVEIPYFMKYQQTYAGSGLQIIGIGLDEAQKLRIYACILNINYPILHADPEQQYALLNQCGAPRWAFCPLPLSSIVKQLLEQPTGLKP